jgi:hypothetical protein
MGFSVDADIYEGDVLADGQVEGMQDVAPDEELLHRYADLRIEEGLTMKEAAQRLGVGVDVAKNLNRIFLRSGRPDPRAWSE